MSANRRVLRAADLPPDFANVLQGMTVDGKPPTTLAETVDALDRLWKSAGIMVSVEQMYQPETTRHAVDFGDQIEYVPCVLDAVIAALVVGTTPVEVRSAEPNSNESVRLSVTDAGVEVDPVTAVFSFGVAEGDVQNPDLSVLEGTDSVVMASCLYINAFRDVTGYRQWQEQLSGARAMKIDVETLVAFAEIAAEEWVTDESA